MEGAELLCPCQSGLPLGQCCGPFRDAPSVSGPASLPVARASLRRLLLELSRRAAALPELWFACLEDFSEPEREVLERDPSLAQPLLDHFLWDWFRRYSEARPIARIARELESVDLRTASRLDAWSLSAWEPWIVEEARGEGWSLRRIGTDDRKRLHRAFPHHQARAGDGLLLRTLPHLGHDFVGLSVQRFPGRRGAKALEHSWAALCRRHGVSPAVHLRPDVHNELWESFHRDLLRLHPALDGLETVEPTPSDDELAQVLETPLAELGHQSPLQARGHELGRHRLVRWLERRAATGEDVAELRRLLDLRAPHSGDLP